MEKYIISGVIILALIIAAVCIFAACKSDIPDGPGMINGYRQISQEEAREMMEGWVGILDTGHHGPYHWGKLSSAPIRGCHAGKLAKFSREVRSLGIYVQSLYFKC